LAAERLRILPSRFLLRPQPQVPRRFAWHLFPGFDRTQEYAARRRGEDFDRLQYATREILTLDPLPCWKGLTEKQRQRRATALVADIEAKAAARRKKRGIKTLGPTAILTQDPHRQSARSKKSPAPAFYAASQAVRRQLREAYALFVAAYREAAEKLRSGEPQCLFPYRELSSCVAVRGWVGRRREVFDLTTVLDWRPVSGDWERCIESGSSGKNSGSWDRLFQSRSSLGRVRDGPDEAGKSFRRRATGGRRGIRRSYRGSSISLGRAPVSARPAFVEGGCIGTLHHGNMAQTRRYHIF
jgi:hypothetical protein